ncbi:MAG: AEC family transporter [Halobacteria archaeon]
MVSVFNAFATAVFPILVIAGTGYVLGRVKKLDPKPIATVTIYVLTPVLVYHSLVTTKIGGEEGAKIVAVSIVMTVVMWGMAKTVGLFRDGGPEFELAAAFPNTANYGIPLSAFAFPSLGKSTAVLYVVGSTVMMYTVGIYIISKGSSILESGKQVFRLPLIYAVGLAALTRAVDLQLPPEHLGTLGLVGNSAIPLMLLVLGMQVSDTRPSRSLKKVGDINITRLVLAPIAAVPVAILAGFSDPAVAKVVVLESSMPVAVTTLIFAIEFERDREYAAAAIVTTTLLSIFTVTGLITLLKSGFLL